MAWYPAETRTSGWTLARSGIGPSRTSLRGKDHMPQTNLPGVDSQAGLRSSPGPAGDPNKKRKPNAKSVRTMDSTAGKKNTNLVTKAVGKSTSYQKRCGRTPGTELGKTKAHPDQIESIQGKMMRTRSDNARPLRFWM